MPPTTPADSIETAVRQFSRHIRDELPSLEARYQRALRADGFAALSAEALHSVSPIAAARTILARRSLRSFWPAVEDAGRRLAKMNVTPTDVSRALQGCEQFIDRVEGISRFDRTRDQLKFATILALNQAYYDVREEESNALHELLKIEAEATNTDVLLRRFVEAMASACGAAAAHVFLLSHVGKQFELGASSAQGASPKTKVLVAATAPLRRFLATPREVTNAAYILDAGWAKLYSSVWSIPLGAAGVVQLGFSEKRVLLPREIELLTAAGERCRRAAERTYLLEDIAYREEQLSKLAIRMLMVEENERRRISRELHDDAGQSLVVIRLQMELIEQSLGPNTEERERLAEARDLTEKTILDIRRLIADLSPAVLQQLGLGAALRQLANRFRARYPCRIGVAVGDLPQLDTNFQLIVYRLAQECLNNISQHSGATIVNISVSSADNTLLLTVEDNGAGFNVNEALDRANAFGLLGIRERVAVPGGKVVFLSTPKKGQNGRRRRKSGTLIEIQLPIR